MNLVKISIRSECNWMQVLQEVERNYEDCKGKGEILWEYKA